jgi:hypothetical protein
MTLRDVGDWFAGLWASFLDGLHIAATQSFWDWPLWLSIPVGIGVPWLILWLIANHIRETRNERAGFWGSLGFTVGSLVCAYVTYDIWIGGSIFDEEPRGMIFTQIIYPVMSIVFGFAGLHGFASRRRHEDNDQ